MKQHADDVRQKNGEYVWPVRRKRDGALLGRDEYVVGEEAYEEARKGDSRQIIRYYREGWTRMSYSM